MRWVGVLALGVGVALGCREASSPPPSAHDSSGARARPLPLALAFEPIDLPKIRSEAVISTRGAILDGVKVDIGWRPLLREGQEVGGETFGLLIDELGRPLAQDPLCGHADFGALVESHGSLWHFAHLECMPGGIWLTRLDQGDDGSLSPVRTTPVDLSAVHGGKHFCAGDITPWGTLLSGEEYDADARRVLPSGAFVEGYAYADYDPVRMGAYLDGPRRLPYVYDHGWVDEVRIEDPSGATSVAKRFSMGRFSHEIARVLPDRRTVYLSDDGVNGGLFMFVADRAGDLSAGRLYAARWEQESAAGGGRARLSWVPLGHASDAHVGRALRAGALHHDELLEHAEPSGGACPEGFASINDAWGHQCLRPRPGADAQVLSRVETRRFAALRGATTELRKGEGIAYDPDRDVVYFAIASIGRGMLAGDPVWDAGGPDHVRLEPNPCGGVYALPLAGGVIDTAGEPIDSESVATRIDALVMGRAEGAGCATGAIANPDNIAYLPGSGVLTIAEDSPVRANNLLWAIDVAAVHRGAPEAGVPILAVPPGAEVTGLRWFPDIGGFGYLTTTVQHPWQRTPEERTRSIEDRMGTFGFFGPFPSLAPLDAPNGPE